MVVFLDRSLTGRAAGRVPARLSALPSGSSSACGVLPETLCLRLRGKGHFSHYGRYERIANRS